MYTPNAFSYVTESTYLELWSSEFEAAFEEAVSHECSRTPENI